MILVDTSIWIDHLRKGSEALMAILHDDLVCIHPWIVGELACGNLSNRSGVLELLGSLPSLTPASENEALHFIEKRQLMGKGIGYIDVHLLASSVIHGTHVWTRDKHLMSVAMDIGVAYQPNAH